MRSTTVTSPATSKNCIAVGATQTLLTRYKSDVQTKVFSMRVRTRAAGSLGEWSAEDHGW